MGGSNYQGRLELVQEAVAELLGLRESRHQDRRSSVEVSCKKFFPEEIARHPRLESSTEGSQAHVFIQILEVEGLGIVTDEAILRVIFNCAAALREEGYGEFPLIVSMDGRYAVADFRKPLSEVKVDFEEFARDAIEYWGLQINEALQEAITLWKLPQDRYYLVLRPKLLSVVLHDSLRGTETQISLNLALKRDWLLGSIARVLVGPQPPMNASPSLSVRPAQVADLKSNRRTSVRDQRRLSF